MATMCHNKWLQFNTRICIQMISILNKTASTAPNIGDSNGRAENEQLKCY